MKNIKPFGPSIGKTKISKKFLDILNKEIDNKDLTKKNDYSSKLASQIKKEVSRAKILFDKNLMFNKLPICPPISTAKNNGQ